MGLNSAVKFKDAPAANGPVCLCILVLEGGDLSSI